jgi:Cu+-exporting ATPase
MPHQHVTLPIEDFGCSGSGAIVVERALTKVPGVLRVYVNAATEMAYVEYDTDRCDSEALRAAVARAGFHAGDPIAL